MKAWQLQDATARLSELVKSTREAGPQEITVRGQAAAVVLSKADYDSLKRRKPTFLVFMRHSPLVGIELDTRREKSPARNVEV